jgi:hypothetical protein
MSEHNEYMLMDPNLISSDNNLSSTNLDNEILSDASLLVKEALSKREESLVIEDFNEQLRHSLNELNRLVKQGDENDDKSHPYIKNITKSSGLFDCIYELLNCKKKEV